MLKTMPWDDEVWRKLKDAMSPMPLFIRKKALKKIIEASESVAQERGALIVQEEDLVRAAREKAPALSRQRMLDALAEQGIRIEVPEEEIQGRKVVTSHQGKPVHFIAYPLPGEFIRWQVESRRKALEAALGGKQSFGSLGVHLPAVGTLEPEGAAFPVNVAIKGVGMVVKEEILEKTATCLERSLGKSSQERLEVLLELYAAPSCFDPYLLGGLELYGKRTLRNIKANPYVSLLFLDFTPAPLSYQVNCVAEVVEKGEPFYRYESVMHALFHPEGGTEPLFAYRFHTCGVYSKSPGPDADSKIR
jgi:hypothetical protein